MALVNYYAANKQFVIESEALKEFAKEIGLFPLTELCGNLGSSPRIRRGPSLFTLFSQKQNHSG
jgi:hypothetical protein